MNRRALLAAALICAAAPAVAQAPAGSDKQVEVGRIFPYLANYLKLPAAERSRWTVGYRFTRDGKPASNLNGWVEDGSTRVPLEIDGDGRPRRLPTLAHLEAKRTVEFDLPPTAKMGVSMSPELSMRPAAEMPTGELAAGITQATAGARRAAPMAVRMLVPKFDRVFFPGAEGGEVVLADGRVTPLPRSAELNAPYFRPADHPAARTVRFKNPPRRLPVGAP